MAPQQSVIAPLLDCGYQRAVEAQAASGGFGNSRVRALWLLEPIRCQIRFQRELGFQSRARQWSTWLEQTEWLLWEQTRMFIYTGKDSR